MSKRSSLTLILTFCASLAVAMSPAVRAVAELDGLPLVSSPIFAGPSQRLFLVFQHAQPGARVPQQYRVFDFAGGGALMARYMTRMATEGYRFRSVIPVPELAVPEPRAVGVPGATSNVLGVGNVPGAVIRRPDAMLLVFHRDEPAQRDRRQNRRAYRVVRTAPHALQAERHMNEMAARQFHYRTAMILPDNSAEGRPEAVHRPQPAVAGGFAVDIMTEQIVLAPGHPPVPATPWERRPGSESIYRVIQGGTWAECEAIAVAQGAHLVTINDAEEQAWLAETYPTIRPWIGFTDEGTEGVWRWVSGEEVTYTNWAAQTDEPSNQWGGEHFAQMNWGRNGEWNDLGPASPEWGGVTHGIIERAVGD